MSQEICHFYLELRGDATNGKKTGRHHTVTDEPAGGALSDSSSDVGLTVRVGGPNVGPEA